MRFSTIAAPVALAGLVAAAPAPVKRDVQPRAAATYDDATILNYALTLEHLERAFYQQSLNKFGPEAFLKGLGPKHSQYYVRQRFTEIASQEATHVNFLTTALTAAGATPVQECTYDFGVDSVATFRTLSEVFEGVGVAAYLGAAPSITNKAYLAVAGSILIVEAEHNTWVRSAADNQDPATRPFYAPLDFNQVFSLVAPFIKSCPTNNPTLPFSAFPAVTIKAEPFYKAGCQLTVSTKATGAKYAAFISATSTVFVPFNGQTSTVPIPEGITGQSFLVLTNSNEGVTDAQTVAGPAMIYVDVPAQNFNYN